MDECRSNVLANFKLCEQVAVLAFLDLSQCMSQSRTILFCLLPFPVFTIIISIMNIILSVYCIVIVLVKKITICFYDLEIQYETEFIVSRVQLKCIRFVNRFYALQVENLVISADNQLPFLFL